LLKVPTDGDMDQFTAVLLVPLKAALSVADWPPVSDAVAGDTLIEIGSNEIVALALLVESAALVAFTVMVCADPITAGAV
jgi:hypothetical protein